MAHVFNSACTYIENFLNGVLSCEDAKISQVYS